MKSKFCALIVSVFDTIEHYWENERGQKVIGTILVLCFMFFIVVIYINSLGWLPSPLDKFIPTKVFSSIQIAFTLLLVFEVASLVFSLAYSVSTSIGKQFEILSLVLLRDAFKQFAHFEKPFQWDHIEPSVFIIIATVFGALAIFTILGFYYRIQRHIPITSVEKDRLSFIVAKKIIALGLLFSFAGIIIEYSINYFHHIPSTSIFNSFYILLIFSNILIMLISIHYGSSYRVAFRNSGFAVATLIICLALIAPAYYNVLLGIAGSLLILAISFAYRAYTPSLYQRKREVRKSKLENR